MMGRLFGGDDTDDAPSEDRKEPDYNDSDFQKRDLYKKGLNHMSNEKFLDAIRSFDLALRLDSQYVDAWIKRGYAHFHLGEYTVAIRSYDRALETDVNNAEAWNLKGLAYYKMKNYDKAIECCEKAIDIDPNDGMSWYNKACYLTLSGKVDEGLDSLKRSIEIDIQNARKAVRDRDFENARAEEGFRRIVEVVVLESIRQGYDYVGKIVWVTAMDKIEIEDALMRLAMKGLVIKHDRKTFTGKEEYYELPKEIADKVGVTKRTGLFSSKQVSAPVQQLKDIKEVLGKARESIENGDLVGTLQYFDELVSPTKHGSAMVEQFFDAHRDLRLYKIRLHDKGQEYLNAHKSDLIDLITRIDHSVGSGVAKSPAKD
ncbi:MAG: tetratricopeptide repeat protein [Thaumarchaeota archaeon]|nr:MAG: tetratricopeptide repeat protein [Nitrososphaerota archaeon]TLY07981.1 MAG: tetratricopeptide repeat protein [Nitrososphaerota archaeon]